MNQNTDIDKPSIVVAEKVVGGWIVLGLRLRGEREVIVFHQKKK